MASNALGDQRAAFCFELSTINDYLAYKQHLLPEARLSDVVQVSRDLVALHASGPAVPYLSLWARVPSFHRGTLDDALYKQREVARVLCMRVTLHIVPSDQVPFFLRACQVTVERRTPPRFRGANLLTEAGLCPANEADALLEKLERQIVDLLAKDGPSTLPEISQHVPELRATMRHDVGKAYEGHFSIGSRLVPEMCAQGKLIRAQPRGSWRSNLYEYAALGDWLPGADPEQVDPQQAQTWLVRRYLSAFGPVLFGDIRWWTGFTKSETQRALETLEPEIVSVTIDNLDGDHVMLAGDAWNLSNFPRPETPTVFFLPGLDPYIMGYRNRRRYLAARHETHVLARAGNTVPTVWVNGRVMGAWGQQPDGSLAYRLFEPVGQEEKAMLTRQAARLDSFLAGEYLAPRYHTPFTRNLEQGNVRPGTES